MTNKQLNSHIKKRIRSGTSKSELYAELSEVAEDEVLRKALALQPSYELRTYFKKYYWLVSVIIGIFVLVELLGLYGFFLDYRIERLIPISVSVYLAVKIWNFSGPFFLSGVIWLSFSFFQGYYHLYSLTHDPDFGILKIITVIYSIVILFGIIFMWMIYRNVFGYYHWFQPKVDDENRSMFE